MRGLRPEEVAKLRFLAEPHEHRPAELEDLLMDLIEQGRVERRATPDHPYFSNMYLITPAGREALRLWPAVQAALGDA